MNDNQHRNRKWYVVSLGATINLIVFAMATACLPVLFSEISDELGLSIVQIGTVWGIGPVYASPAVGIVHSFTRVGYTFATPAGNSFASIQPGLPFVFWAGLALMALVVFLFVQETGRGGERLPATEV